MGSKRVKQSDGGNGNENGHSKAEEEATGVGSDHGKYEKLQSKSEVKPPEPPKDYIHVRARRGQATDSHSLAERVRIPVRTGKRIRVILLKLSETTLDLVALTLTLVILR